MVINILRKLAFSNTSRESKILKSYTQQILK